MVLGLGKSKEKKRRRGEEEKRWATGQGSRPFDRFLV
jgi:hypothetical protein